MQWLVSSLLLQDILRDNFFAQKNVCVKRLWTFLLKQYCLSPCPKRIRPPIKPLLKNSFSTHFQGTGPWEGPVHFSRLVLRVHNCSKLFHGWSWSQEKKVKHRKAFYKSNSKVQTDAFPKRIRPLIKPLLKSSSSTNFQRTGPWEGPVHLSRFVFRVHNCRSFSMADPGAKRRKKNLLQKQSPSSKRIRPLIKPLLKNSFSTIFQGTGPWEGPVHFSRCVLRAHNCSKFFQSWSWSQRKKKTYKCISLYLPLPPSLSISLSLCSSSCFFFFFFLFSFLFFFFFLFLSLSLSFSVSLSLSLFLSLSLILLLEWKNLRWNR